MSDWDFWRRQQPQWQQQNQQQPVGPAAVSPQQEPAPAPLAPGLASEATLHLVGIESTPGAPGVLYKLFKRTELHTIEQVGALWIGGDGMRHRLIADHVCVVLDEELKGR